MLMLMMYNRGMNAKQVVFENENAAKVWLKQNNITNPRAYSLVEVEYVKEDTQALKKMELEEKISEIKEKLEWASESYAETGKEYWAEIKNELEEKYNALKEELNNL